MIMISEKEFYRTIEELLEFSRQHPALQDSRLDVSVRCRYFPTHFFILVSIAKQRLNLIELVRGRRTLRVRK